MGIHKYFILSLCMAGWHLQVALAQSPNGPKDHLGLSAAAQATDLVGSGAGFGNHPRWGFNLRGYYESTIEGRLFSRFGLMFSQKGAHVSIVPENVTIDQQLNYLEVPFSLNMEITTGISIGAGVYGSLLLWSQFEDPPASAQSRITYRKENLNALDIGYLLDLSYLAASGISAGIRYERGFQTTDGANPFRFNQVIAFYAGYLFQYSRKG